MSDTARLSSVVLDHGGATPLPPLIEADCARAVADLAAASRFVPVAVARHGPVPDGPYTLLLSIRHGRLLFDIRREDDMPLAAVGLALGPFRSLIKDYKLLVDSHGAAVQEGRMERIQAIDMGRRGLHNEGAELLRQRLHGKIDIDFETARRLFSLVCALHHRVSAR